MINGFYKYSLSLIVALSASSLALAAPPAPVAGATASPATGATTPAGTSPQQNHTDQKNLRNIDADRRYQRDLEIARLEKEKAKVRGELQKEQAALAQEEAKRQAVLESLPAKRDKLILAEIAKTQEGSMDEPTRMAFKEFIVKEYPNLATDTAEENPLSLGAAATPEKVSEVISQFKVRMEIAESLKSDVASAAQNIGPEKAKAEAGDGKKPEAADKPSLEELRKTEESMQQNFQDNLRAIFKKRVGAKNASAPVTPEKIVRHVNALRDLASLNRNSEPEQARPGFHETPAASGQQ